MLTLNSKTNNDRIYFFESLGYITSKHLKEGAFVKIPSILETTIVMNTPNPTQDNKDLLSDIIRDCNSLELNFAYDIKGFYGVYRFLKTQGVFELPYKIHTLKKL
jgi:hypothetical protein